MSIKLEKILVAKDLSKESSHVVRYALELAGHCDSRRWIAGTEHRPAQQQQHSERRDIGRADRRGIKLRRCF